MQDLSFRSVNQIFKLGSYEFYITVHSFQNVYTLDPEKTEVIANSADAGRKRRKAKSAFRQCRRRQESCSSTSPHTSAARRR